ncbi:MaoC family dehydratase N-terminal domain-containing protein [Salicibibacter kimchii]|uniref:MaoC family dehydratase n=1 Tax=Salicibibacter kimchii TaxID=2099786 RepID=A0A345BW33_9BACI|nr:MaoC family dehydratase N-terminal domain-containing protein [Salicibibacter kimchii]AXF55164.1 MaoC family dehydratase [Salicibibacter kimchii]
MSDKQRLVGLEFEPYSLDVEKGKIREFALAIGDYNPIYFEEDAAKKEGFEGIPIPFTFLQVIDMWGGNSFDKKIRMLDLSRGRILHGEQDYEMFADIYAGNRLTVSSKVINVQEKKGSLGAINLITTENTYTNQQDEKVVAISRNTLVEKLYKMGRRKLNECH